jgi:acetolactate synthase I/II/III large subunit
VRCRTGLWCASQATGESGTSELETAARWNIPVTVVINNNNAFNQEIPLWKAAYEGELRGNHAQMWQFRPTNFAKVAAEFGIDSVRVEDPADLTTALKQAIASEQPTLVEVLTDIWATAPKPKDPA